MKIALGLLVAAQLLTAPSVAINMDSYEVPESVIYYGEEEGPTRQEQFQWFYRIYNGHQQKRLWSITYGRWVTDWIDC